MCEGIGARKSRSCAHSNGYPSTCKFAGSWVHDRFWRCVLTLSAAGAESLWDAILPEEVRVLPEDLARLDELLADPGLVAPIALR